MPHMHISIISMLLALEYFMPLSPFTKNTIDVLIIALQLWYVNKKILIFHFNFLISQKNPRKIY